MTEDQWLSLHRTDADARVPAGQWDRHRKETSVYSRRRAAASTDLAPARRGRPGGRRNVGAVRGRAGQRGGVDGRRLGQSGLQEHRRQACRRFRHGRGQAARGGPPRRCVRAHVPGPGAGSPDRPSSLRLRTTAVPHAPIRSPLADAARAVVGPDGLRGADRPAGPRPSPWLAGPRSGPAGGPGRRLGGGRGRRARGVQHLRGSAEHIRGCWCLGLVTGRS